MYVKRFFCAILMCFVALNCLCGNVAAAEADPPLEITLARATGRFTISVPANKLVTANSTFPLSAGESVTIKGSYTPFSANLDVGLIAPNGLFYSVNVSNGTIDETLVVNQNGNYTFAIRNNSSVDVSVTGFVNY